MNFNVKFHEQKHDFPVNFGEIQTATDGGYERGYAEGEAKGYTNGYETGAKEGAEVGYAKGEADGYEKGHTEGLEDGIEQGFEAGMISNGAYYADVIGFSGTVFPENYDFVMRLRIARSVSFLRATNLKSVKLIADNTDNTISLHQILRECATVEILDLTEYSRKISAATYSFLTTTNIRSIYGALDLSSCSEYTHWLNGANKLEDIEIVPGTIKTSIPFSWNNNLTDASIQSIIDGLADLTGATAQTLSFTNTVGKKLTQAQKDAISAKNWTLVY